MSWNLRGRAMMEGPRLYMKAGEAPNKKTDSQFSEEGQ